MPNKQQDEFRTLSTKELRDMPLEKLQQMTPQQRAQFVGELARRGLNENALKA